MPRQYDKYGFNRQYLRRPLRRKSPFPHRLPFCDGFSTGALIHKVLSAPPSKSASVPQNNVPTKEPGHLPGELTRREPLPPDMGRNHYKRMSVTKAISTFVKREVVSLGEAGTVGFIASELAEPGGPIVALGGGLAVSTMIFEADTGRNLVHLLYDLLHKKQTEFKRASPYGPSSNHRGHNFRFEGLD